jgi:hypothetical protein
MDNDKTLFDRVLAKLLRSEKASRGGVIDRATWKDAASVIGLMLTTEAAIADGLKDD